METVSRRVVAIILGVVVMAALVILLVNVFKPVPTEIDLQKAYQRGCGILATNKCNFDIIVDGMEFKEIIKKLGYSEKTVREQCCYGIGGGETGIPEISEGKEGESKCGNGICEEGETQDTCCIDCGCPEGYTCVNNKCESSEPIPVPAPSPTPP